MSIEKFADGTALDPDLGPRPLSGVRVLDLTRVIAGPVCTRTLAAYSAEILTIRVRISHGLTRSAWIPAEARDRLFCTYQWACMSSVTPKPVGVALWPY